MAMIAARENPMAEINVTPLVDVMLVLLIIFMVTAPAMTRTLGIELPFDAKTPPKIVPEMTMQVQAGDVYVLDGQAMTRQQVTQALVAARATNPDLKVKFLVEDEAEYESAVRGMAAVRNAGIEAIALPKED
jgi:biopolymer transport protein ExbD/biopolymer transport protein TolR